MTEIGVKRKYGKFHVSYVFTIKGSRMLLSWKGKGKIKVP